MGKLPHIYDAFGGEFMIYKDVIEENCRLKEENDRLQRENLRLDRIITGGGSDREGTTI